jgi:acylphosphatase
METRHVLVTGTVQGVGFRAACRRAAASAGVTGWVRNLDDGRVEAVFTGSRKAVETMVAWCRTGPDAARVEAVDDETLETAPPDLAHRFEVR